MSNPWLALSTYQEKHEKSFFGRDDDKDNLFSMLQQNETVICYAASGEGKSSLIKAGLCPKLRRSDMFPVNIIFASDDHFDKESEFDDIILKSIKQSFSDYEKMVADKVKDLGVEKKGEFDFVDVTNISSLVSNSLWWKLRTQKIHSPYGGTELTPVLIFDQFEEIFRAPWKALFFSWLQKLTNDVCPDEIIKDLKGEANNLPNRKLFKLLFSMRYEYVGELDYWCSQRNFIPQMMRNRYFLKPLTTLKAYSIIDEQEQNDSSKQEQIEEKKDALEKRPSERLKDNKERIVESIKNSKNRDVSSTISENNDEIPAIILSLVCYVLYYKWENNSSFVLSDQDLDKIINTGIFDYYDEQLNALCVPEEVRNRLESVLTNSNNERVRVAVSDDRLREIQIHKFTTDEKDEEGNSIPNLISTHILKKETIDGIDYIEFIHDRLVLAIKEHNDEMAAKEKERIAKEEIRRAEEEAKKAKEEMERKTQEEGKKRRRLINEICWIIGSVVFLLLIGSLVRSFVGRPIEYDCTRIIPGDTIPRYSKFYTIPNGKLVLKNCTVLPYTFVGNKEIRCVVLDSANIYKKAIFHPQSETPIIDTLIIKSKQFSLSSFDWFNDFKHTKIIYVEKPACFPTKPIAIDSISYIRIANEDSAYFKKHRGTFFALEETDSTNNPRIWHAVFNESTPIMIDSGFFGCDSVAVQRINTIYNYCLGEENNLDDQRLSDKNNNIKLKLICTDKEKDTLYNKDIPIDIRSRFIEADLSNIKVVENNAFSNCINLKVLRLNKATVIGDSAFFNCYNLHDLSLPEATHIGNYAFRYCNKLKKLSLKNANHIGNFAFQNAWIMSELSLPKATCIGIYAFNGCDRLKDLSLPHVDTITEYAFSSCDSLQRLSLPKTTIIGQNAFSYCRSLTEIWAPEARLIGDNAFYECDSLGSVIAPRVKHIGQSAFANCDKLKEVVLDSVIEIHNRAFFNDTLRRLIMPQIEFIGNSAFNINVSNDSVDLVWNGQAFKEWGNYLLDNKQQVGLTNKMSQINLESNPSLEKVLNRLQEIGFSNYPSFTNDTAHKNDNSNCVEYEIRQDEKGCFVVSRKYNNYSNQTQTDLHYFLYSDTIPHLIIEKNNEGVLHYNRKNNNILIADTFDLQSSHIINVTVNAAGMLGVLNYYHGDLYFDSHNGRKLLLRSNREEYVSLPHSISGNIISHGNRCKRYVSLFFTNEIDSFKDDDAKKITLVVPCGQLEFYQTFYGTKFGAIEKLSWYKTIVYRIMYSELHWQIKDKIWHIRNKPVVKSTSIQWDDIFVFLCCVLLLPIPLLLNCFKMRSMSKIWHFIRIRGKSIRSKLILSLFELFVIAVIFGLCGLFHFIRNGYGSMWQTWEYAIPIWLIYLFVTTFWYKRNKNKKQQKELQEIFENKVAD